jgi:hypothetical protein
MYTNVWCVALSSSELIVGEKDRHIFSVTLDFTIVKRQLCISLQLYMQFSMT